MRHGTNTAGDTTSRFMIRAAITRPMCHRVQERHFLGSRPRATVYALYWFRYLRMVKSVTASNNKHREMKSGSLSPTVFIETKTV